jgi:hypothetical protein
MVMALSLVEDVLNRLRQRQEGVRTGIRSINGWEMEEAPGTCGQVQTCSVPGTPLTGVQVRAGEVEAVLAYVIRRFHTEVAELRDGDVTGWCPPGEVRDWLPESNLASGTAVRIHVRFFAPHVVGARTIVRELDGVVRWGGDDPEADESLFFIDAGPEAVMQVARRIREQ